MGKLMPERDESLYLCLLLALSPAVCLGIGRFAYALVLPEMRADLAWSYGQAGWINSVNAAGYLAGALLAPLVGRRYGLSRVVVLATLITALSTLALGLTRSFEWLSFWRFAAGLFGAFGFVLGGALAAELAGSAHRNESLRLGFFYGGAGLGIAISGALAPVITATGGGESWPLVWVGLGIAALLMAGAMTPVLKHQPTTSAGGSQATHAARRMSISAAMPLLLAYGAFGAGYIGYMTFMIAWMRTTGAAAPMVTLFWLSIGCAVLASPWLWARLLRNAAGGRAFALLIATCTVGGVLPLLSARPSAFVLSGLIFGCAFFSVVASTTAFIRRNVHRTEWSRAIGTFTVVFGLGQVVGPTLTGAVSDASGSLTAGLGLTCVLLFAGFLLSVFQGDLIEGKADLARAPANSAGNGSAAGRSS
ncbi:YbfB/YjiJ family MFS transporter [Spiribacter halobius]|uniref:YbfB/YjiJ family MFS transporter n=1 Tax=Sediminicurvatus halobius TaxID=2182432 RepID=UPI001304A259|nr:YbfB/YjiJ family MFS transporter [Spiribacter halobius]UEX77671.1 YbfB/YjiJ family MFS transporter [Spiribacter halobius]